MLVSRWSSECDSKQSFYIIDIHTLNIYLCCDQRGGWLSGVAHAVSYGTAGGTESNVRAVSQELEQYTIRVVKDTKVPDGQSRASYVSTRLKHLATLKKTLLAHNIYLEKYNKRFLLEKTAIALHKGSLQAIEEEKEKLLKEVEDDNLTISNASLCQF